MGTCVYVYLGVYRSTPQRATSVPASKNSPVDCPAIFLFPLSSLFYFSTTTVSLLRASDAKLRTCRHVWMSMSAYIYLLEHVCMSDEYKCVCEGSCR